MVCYSNSIEFHWRAEAFSYNVSHNSPRFYHLFSQDQSHCQKQPVYRMRYVFNLVSFVRANFAKIMCNINFVISNVLTDDTGNCRCFYVLSHHYVSGVIFFVLLG